MFNFIPNFLAGSNKLNADNFAQVLASIQHFYGLIGLSLFNPTVLQ